MITRSVVLGSEALKGARLANECVVVGADAGKESSGERNVCIGKESGKKSGGAENVYIGLGAGYGCAGSGNVFLGAGVSSPVSNTFMVGRGKNTPIVASFETGIVQVPHLVVNDITYSGKLDGPTPPHLLTRNGTNIGNSNTGLYNVAFGEYTGDVGSYNVFSGYGSGKDSIGNKNVYIGFSTGEGSKSHQVVALGNDSASINSGNNVVALGHHAACYNTGDNLVAIGEHAACCNTGNNVIAIGMNAGVSNTQSNMLFVGDVLEANSNVLQICRDLSVAGWMLTDGCAHTDGITITSSNITIGDTHITDTRDETVFSKKVCIGGPLAEYVDRRLIQTEQGVFLGNIRTRSNPFKTLLEWNGEYVGLDEHVYISKTGVSWRPIRSPFLEHITLDGSELLGYGNGVFYRYEQEWVEEERVDKGDYTCFGMAGCYAFGTPLSNSFYEDKGTLLFRSSQEWRLFPGVYPDHYTDAIDIDGYVYVKNHSGTFKLEDRKAVPSSVMFTRELPPHEDIGVYPPSDFSVPESIRIGAHHISSDISGLRVTDGIHDGVLYDTVFNPIPVHLDGLTSLTVKKIGDSLVFEVDIGGTVTGYRIQHLQNTDHSLEQR